MRFHKSQPAGAATLEPPSASTGPCRQVRQSALCKQVVKAKPSPAPCLYHPTAPCLYHLHAGRRVARARR
jgi:hypothetical protein